MANRYITIVVPTEYWRPGHDYLMTISHLLRGNIRAGDVVVVSEKALSIAMGRIVDEAKVRPRLAARLLARIWMRIVWGQFLSRICNLSSVAASRLRSYPLQEGAAHKQLALSYSGPLQSLRHGSEGGIDVSNVPYSYASLPLENAELIAQNILEALQKDNAVAMTVLIVDSDKTYTWRTIHISPRQDALQGILPLSVIAYILGRAFRLRPRSTPIAMAGTPLSVEEALRAAALANKARGSGSGRTAWDMAERFGVGLTEVTYEYLNTIKHRPLVIVRKISHRSGRILQRGYQTGCLKLTDDPISTFQVLFMSGHKLRYLVVGRH